jgi:hypothetical protein
MISLSLIPSLRPSLCDLVPPEAAVEPRLHDLSLSGGLTGSQPLFCTLILPEEAVEPRLHDLPLPDFLPETQPL